MKPTADELLPAVSGPFTRAISFAASDELPVPLREIVDPATTPEEWLPFLAAHESVDLWFDNWASARKRQMVADAPALAALVGTRAAAGRFLDYVDTQIVHKRTYPSRFPVGRIAARITPIQHPNFTARFLLKTALSSHRSAIIISRAAVGRRAMLTPDREPLRRAKTALVASKAPDTAFTVTFAHRIPITLDDGLDLDAGHQFGSFKDRIRL